ncbi:hypothetical protein DMB44_04325 [Thermoplasma sp. Kam2015]|uniref:hypothetical protein n=1 Tax=Thermoplasma sp. Kam2015 TaxID=2094122 RepID=UPI000D99EB87|nr:hypothetical protein [Thermoplasma sp. Kam2015]PYB68566.1 hypothetical protein DMB44_04325 [Thermoplasma sp. Kam2015]
MANNKFEEQVEDFYNYLIKEKCEYLQLFSTLEIQIEGWFRGELMRYFKRNKIELTVYNREVKNNGNIIDFKINTDAQEYWIELKHILVGKQKKGTFTLNSYFSKNYFIAKDLNKLILSENPEKKVYVLSFVSVNNIKIRASNKINNSNDLISQLKGIIDKRGIKAEPSNYNFDEYTKFGYFLLKVNEKQD